MNSLTAKSLTLLLVLVSTSCMSLDYDLSAVPVEISAKPNVAPDAETEPLRIEARNILWVHGYLGHDQPDVAALVADAAEGWDRVAGFRVRQVSNIHHWFTAHLSLTLVRMRKVVIEGVLVRGESP